MQRTSTWQEEKAGQQSIGITKKDLALFGIGFIPVVGPLTQLVHDANKGDVQGVVVDSVFLALDLATLGGAAIVTASAKTTLQRGAKWAARKGTVKITQMIAKKQAEYVARTAVAKIAPVAVRATLNLGKTAVKAYSSMEEFSVLPFDDVDLALACSQRQMGSMLPTPALTREEMASYRTHKVPLHSLAVSNFLRLYDGCSREPDQALIEFAIGDTALLKAFRKALNKVNGDIGMAVARLWTAQLYRAINMALVTDNAGLLQHFMPLIRALNNYLLAFHPTTAVRTRRQSWMTAADAAQLIVGSTYRLGMYVASSRSHEPLPGVGGDEVVWYFDIPASCFQAWDLTLVSFIGHEKEVLLVPYSPVTIRQVNVQNGKTYIFADVPVDGRSLSLNLPTILA